MASQATSLGQAPDKPTGEARYANRYEVREPLARGGMGIVYRAVECSTGEPRAIKRMSVPDDKRAEAYLAAFEREYQALASLQHPRIIRVYEYGVDNEGPYYVMELLDGADLKQAAPIPWRKACLYLRELASTLSLLHARRLLHRDLSPTNVKLTADGHCKLLDFGALAAFGRPRWIVGTPPMVAPEVLSGGMLDQRSDLYALGALAYWMLTGTHAYPCRNLEALPAQWKTPAEPPSSIATDVPAPLDALVMSLLSADPLTRPNSAAEVIMHLDATADLEPESANERRRFAQNLLRSPSFAGRETELAQVQAHIDSLMQGSGVALRIEATEGNGRTRLLEEVGLRAQLAGATVLRTDASAHPGMGGTSRALAFNLLEALPDIVNERGKKHAAVLAELGVGTGDRMPVHAGKPEVQAERSHQPESDVVALYAEVARDKPILIEVDNIEQADDISLSHLLALARSAAEHPIMLVLTERIGHGRPAAKGLPSLREQCRTLALESLTAPETLALARSIFGDVPNVERYSQWLHGQTAGSPLHYLELTRELVEQDFIRHEEGIWILPATRPQLELPEGLGAALDLRIHSLGDAARSLAQCLSLAREQPTFALCRAVMAGTDGGQRDVLSLLDELAQRDVLYAEQEAYRFASAALRDALLRALDKPAYREAHLRLGRAFLSLAKQEDYAVTLEAGWHLIQGGHEEEGADLIVGVLANTLVVRTLQANLVRVGPIAAAALKVYKHARRDVVERVPLLGPLSNAGYFEDYETGTRYGDEAMDALSQLSGMNLARRLRFLGKLLSLGIALLVAFLSFYTLPKRKRRYSFFELLVHLCGTAMTETIHAILSLDADRAERCAAMIEPFSVLPRWMGPAGIHELCVAIQEVGREHQAQAYERFDRLAARFANPRWYRELPQDTRIMCITGCHFGRGVFAIFRNDGRAALESADLLDASGMKLYAMIASQLRQLYHVNRGELALAQRHREAVELHAAHVGTAFQVDLWEPAALLPLHLALGDIVALKLTAHRMDQLAQMAPGLEVYARLAHAALSVVRRDPIEGSIAQIVQRDILRRKPRSFIGWSAAVGAIARAYNQHGRHAEAREICDLTLATLRDDDREYVALFLEVELQAAYADAGMGHEQTACERIDSLLARFDRGELSHPLTLVLLHETRARIAAQFDRWQKYEASAGEAERWARQTGTPALIAKCERLAELKRTEVIAPRRARSAPLDTTATTLLTKQLLTAANRARAAR